MIHGYNYKFLRIDLTDRRCYVDDITEERIIKFLGGRGVAASYYMEEISPTDKALSDGNKLIFFTGILTGLRIPAATKFNLATKSPLTEIYNTTNAGGNFGPWMKTNGIDGFVIEGSSKTPLCLIISEGRVQFRDASDLWGRSTGQTEKILQSKFDNTKISWMAIGPAGEKGVRFATIQTDGRSFGRGGAGAVMGSKNLKTIVILKGAKRPQEADPQELAQLRPEVIRKIKKKKADASKYGRTLLGY